MNYLASVKSKSFFKFVKRRKCIKISIRVMGMNGSKYGLGYL
jgi:hypothetical protein